VPDRPRASRLETLGAWLQVWTPPRDVEVPPLTRRVVLCAVGGLALLALAVALAAPVIDRGKDRAAAEERVRASAHADAARRATLREQRAQRAGVPALRLGPRAPRRARLAARASLVAALERAISADARARAASGEIERRTGETRCRPAARAGAPLEDLSDRSAAFDCLTVTATIAASQRNAAGRLGYPFRGVVDFERARFAWCKTNPVPSEKFIPDPRRIVRLPAACRG